MVAHPHMVNILVPRSMYTYVGATSTSSGFVLDSATKGIAYGVSYIRQASAITDVYVFVVAVAGSPLTLTASIRVAPNTAAIGAVLASTTATCRASGGGWMRFTFETPIAIPAFTAFYVTVTAATADGANNCTIATASGASLSTATYDGACYTTANSFANLTLATRGGTPVVVKFADGWVWGMPYTKNVPDTPATRRALLIPVLSSRVDLVAVAGNIAFSNPGLSITDLASGEVSQHSLYTNTLGAYPSLESPVPLMPGKSYRIELNIPSANGRPGFVEIEDPDGFADLLLARFDGWQRAELSGGVWTAQPMKMPNISLVLDYPLAAGGGSSGPRLPREVFR